MQHVKDHQTLTLSWKQTHPCSSILVRSSMDTIYYPALYTNLTHILSKGIGKDTHLYCPAGHLLSRRDSFLSLVPHQLYVINITRCTCPIYAARHTVHESHYKSENVISRQNSWIWPKGATLCHITNAAATYEWQNMNGQSTNSFVLCIRAMSTV